MSDINLDGAIDSTEILQHSAYYPFGAEHQSSKTGDYAYRYNGNEKEIAFDIGLLRFEARDMDPWTGRFRGIDPISDQFPHVSPYNYAENRVPNGIDLKEFYSTENEEIVQTYLDYLYANELIFYSSLPEEHFPRIKNDFLQPPGITNLIWDDVSKYSLEEITEIFNSNEDYFSGYIELRMFSRVPLLKLTEIIEIFEQETMLMGITLILPYSSQNLINDFIKLFKEFPRLWSVVLFGALEESIIEVDNEIKKNLILTTKMISSSLCCGNINVELFSNTTQHIRESLSHNSCLNRKLSIDSYGNIKNCPSMTESYGNIKKTTLAEAIEKPGFKKYWNINKDQIAVCRDCEFRYICTDCRAYVEDPHDTSGPEGTNLSKPLKCGYDPYTGEWSEWSTSPIKEKAIKFYKMGTILTNS